MRDGQAGVLGALAKPATAGRNTPLPPPLKFDDIPAGTLGACKPAAVLVRHLRHEAERIPHTERASCADITRADGGHRDRRRSATRHNRGLISAAHGERRSEEKLGHAAARRGSDIQ